VITVCPICGKPVAPRQANRAYPFCSDRCRLIDLGKWLGEEYRIPGPRAGDGGARPPPPEDDEEP
jgi:endogenous inhibitor of DNA gyrase (YacG/DUF329 family)